MTTDLFDRVRVVDVDSHLTEPPDVWTARTPKALCWPTWPAGTWRGRRTST